MTKNSNDAAGGFSGSNIFWAIISLLAALFIWVYMTGTQEQLIDKPFDNIEVVVSGAEYLQESKGLVITGIDVQTVSVKISGQRSVIANIKASDIKAVVDVTSIINTGTNEWLYELSYPDSVNPDSITVVSKSPDFIKINVAKLATKQVPVKGTFTGSTAEGYVVEELNFSPEYVTLSGPSSELDKIDDVWVEIGGEEVRRSRTADLEFNYRDADKNVLEINDVTADYETISTTLRISYSREVSLNVYSIPGAGATDANTVYTIDPETIRISGDPEVVEGINRIYVATINLADFASTYEGTYAIVPPNDVLNITGTSEVTVKIEIFGLETRRMNVTNFSFINLAEGYEAEIITKNLEVTIRASAADFANIRSTNIRAVADLTHISATGDVTVPVKIYVDGFPDAGAIGESKITINIS